MTTYQVPYTFVPGTKAKATEVNANFSAVVDLVAQTNNSCAARDLSNLSQDGLDVIYRNSSHSKLLGEIITTLIPLTDSGLHLLDGAIISGGGMYHDFVEYIAGIFPTRPDLFLSEADWQEQATTNGICGKFVYDAQNNTVRLPKIEGFVQGTSDLTKIGDFVKAGLPNHTHSPLMVGATDADNGGVGGAYILMDDAGAKSTRTVANSSTGTVTDTTVYGQAQKVQPESVKVLYYIVISTTSKLEIVADMDEIATDLNEKLNASDVKRYVVETYQNGTEWYTIYSDGWMEQGGKCYPSLAPNYGTLTLLKPFSSGQYSILCAKSGGEDSARFLPQTTIVNNSTFLISIAASNTGAGTRETTWFAYGY